MLCTPRPAARGSRSVNFVNNLLTYLSPGAATSLAVLVGASRVSLPISPFQDQDLVLGPSGAPAAEENSPAEVLPLSGLRRMNRSNI